VLGASLYQQVQPPPTQPQGRASGITYQASESCHVLLCINTCLLYLRDLKGTVAWDGFFAHSNPSGLVKGSIKFFGLGRLITELWRKLRHCAYSASTPSDAKRIRRAHSILFRVLAEYAQLHSASSPSTFSFIERTQRGFLWGFKNLPFHVHARRVCIVQLRVLGEYV